MSAAARSLIAAALLAWLTPAAAALLDLTKEERAAILQHGPWPPPLARDSSNRVSGNRDAARLGELLFFDMRLSTGGRQSCACCHDPKRAWSDGRAMAAGHDEIRRNTIGVANARFNRRFSWSGAADSLWAASLRPLMDAREIGAAERDVVTLIRSQPDLSRAYRQAFGRTVPQDDEARRQLVGDVAVRAVAAGIVINPSIYPSVRFNPLKDFVPITLGITVPNILVVHPSVPANSTKALIALAKSKAGTLVFASAGTGTSGHLVLELFRMNAGIDVIHVPYKGGGPALTDLIGGQAQALFSIALAALPHIKSGRARPLAVSSAKRSQVAPELPTVAEAGFPGFEVVGWFGWVGPAAMLQPIVKRLNAALVAALKAPEVRERLLSQATEPVGNTPEAFGAFMKSEYVKWAKVIKAANIKPE